MLLTPVSHEFPNNLKQHQVYTDIHFENNNWLGKLLMNTQNPVLML